MKQKVILALIAIAVIFGGVYLYMSQNKVVAPEDVTNMNSNVNGDEIIGELPGDPPDVDPTVPTSDTIAVSTQIAGDSVTVDNAFLEKVGFISIHEVDSKGKPGAVIGVSGLLTAGVKQDLEIKAMLKPGAKYMAVLRVDDGDKKFNVAKDLAVQKNNIDLMTMFSVSQ